MIDLSNNEKHQSTPIFIHLDQSVVKYHRKLNTISLSKLFSLSECDFSGLYLSAKDSLISPFNNSKLILAHYGAKYSMDPTWRIP